MSDGDKDPFHFHPVLVASVITTILVAGSFYLWRPNLGPPLTPLERSVRPDDALSNPPGPSTSSLTVSGADREDAEKSKTSRSKERRRRGKDPLRDILKSGKKLKALSKLNLTPAELDRLNTVTTTDSPPTIDSPQPGSSVTASTAPSSRSESSSRSRTRNAGHEMCATELLQLPDSNGEPSVTREPSQKRSLGLAQNQRDSDLVSQKSELEGPPDPLSSIQGIASPPYSGVLNKSATVLRPDINPSQTDAPSPIQPPPISISASSPAVIIYSQQDPSASEDSQQDFPEPSDGHPRLSAPIATSSRRQQNIPYLESGGLTTSSTLSVINGSHSTRRVPAPRRTPTPSSRASSPPPSLTTQTQIASLRGALEAARQREAQMKSDLERYSKELDYMRWEGASWRRREHELQNQVQYLAHHWQAFAASIPQIASNTSSAGPSVPLNGVTSPRGSNSSSSPNISPTKEGFQVPLPPENASLQHLHTLTPSAQATTPSTMFSPLSVIHPLPPSPYYPYPHIYPFPISATHPISNQASLMAAFSHHHAPSPSPGPSASGPSSATGSSSSVGSMSPDIGNSTITMADRGRRKTRGNAHAGDWVDGRAFISEEVTIDNGSDDGGGGVSDILADAILKRPGTLGLGKAWGKRTRFTEASKSATEESDSEIIQTEFTFPSLSNFGNVNGRNKANQHRMDDGDYIDQLEDSRPISSTSPAVEASMYGPPALNPRTSVLGRPQPGVTELPAG